MISIFQAVILGLLQGFSELFPISSLGHSVILPKLLGWNIHQNDSFFLTFLVATHLATAIVLFIFFWAEWMQILRGLGRSFTQRQIKESDTYAKLGWLLVVGTIPAGIIGLLFQDSLRKLFNSAETAAAFLILNGFILLVAERLRRNRLSAANQTSARSDQHIAKLKWRQAIGIGTVQAAALFPGISRSGSSMAGSLLAGLDNEAAARFSFMLATPIIGAAAILKLPELFSSSAASLRVPALVGALCSALAAYISVRFLTKYFRTNTLTPFGLYCLAAGVLAFTYLYLK
ncbi:MAG: Undecaprenyl-diphosphatase [Candidatus Saccharibacteria bacterium]|nr:Undecaprenyl-diphosphatase [Candidatus Saccharibacteria bacterium]